MASISGTGLLPGTTSMFDGIIPHLFGCILQTDCFKRAEARSLFDV